MEALDLVKKDMIIVPLMSCAKNDVIRDLVNKYTEVNNLDDNISDKIYDACIYRESLGSTTMGNGIAIPHAKLDFIKESALVIGVSRLPVDFGDNGETCQIFFLLLAPQDKPSEHVQVLSSIARVCSSSVFVRLLKGAKTKEEVIELFFD